MSTVWSWRSSLRARGGRGSKLAVAGVLSALVVSAGCGSGPSSASASSLAAASKTVSTKAVPKSASSSATSVVGSSSRAFSGLKKSPVTLFDGSGAFAEVRFTVTPGSKRAGGLKGVFEGCALLARSAAEHAQGLMQRTISPATTR